MDSALSIMSRYLDVPEYTSLARGEGNPFRPIAQCTEKRVTIGFFSFFLADDTEAGVTRLALAAPNKAANDSENSGCNRHQTTGESGEGIGGEDPGDDRAEAGGDGTNRSRVRSW